MFELDLRHYTATLLHPCHRQLKGCSNIEREQMYCYVREEMKRIVSQLNQQDVASPKIKRNKVQASILQEYEDDDLNLLEVEDNSSGSKEFGYKALQTDELTR